jgi:hypothetical protein
LPPVRLDGGYEFSLDRPKRCFTRSHALERHSVSDETIFLPLEIVLK